MRFLNHLYFGPNFGVFFLFLEGGWTALERFSSSANHSGPHFCSDPPLSPKASYGPEL